MTEAETAALWELLAVIQPHIVDGAEARRVAELLEHFDTDAAGIWWRRAAGLGDADAVDYLAVMSTEPAVSEPGVRPTGHDASMSEVHKITAIDGVWRPGDVVLDADGNIRVRSASPQWPWDYPNEGFTRDAFGGTSVPEGGLKDEDLERPLTLLVRDGQAVVGHGANG